jgi:catechol 2,3-dioxygenase-like lactoylglutathione lyase family enzyme
MIKHLDHVTIVVRDVEAAKQFFGLLGFSEDKSVVIAGPRFSAYMGVDGIEADTSHSPSPMSRRARRSSY